MTETGANNPGVCSTARSAKVHRMGEADIDTRQLYMQQVGKYPLMTAEEEVMYAKEFQEARKKLNRIVERYPQLVYEMLCKLAVDCGTVHIDTYMGGENEDDEDTSDSCVREKLNTALTSFAKLFNGRGDAASSLSEKQSKEFWKGVESLSLQDPFYDKCLEHLALAEVHSRYMSESSWGELSVEIRDAHEAKESAHRVMVERNLRLVISVAKSMPCGHMSMQDLIQEGNIGLMHAVEKYDYTRGHRFSTYATFWIKNSINRCQANHSRVIRIPVNTLNLIQIIRKAERQLLEKTGEAPTAEAIADVVDMPRPRVRALLRMSEQPVSLQAALDENSQLAELIPDDDVEDPRIGAERRWLKDAVVKAMARLDAREKFIIESRYGLNDKPPLKMSEIGEKLELSVERVRQLEVQAIQKLRKPGSMKYFDGY